jgi:hypothetical protein
MRVQLLICIILYHNFAGKTLTCNKISYKVCNGKYLHAITTVNRYANKILVGKHRRGFLCLLDSRFNPVGKTTVNSEYKVHRIQTDLQANVVLPNIYNKRDLIAQNSGSVESEVTSQYN